MKLTQVVAYCLTGHRYNLLVPIENREAAKKAALTWLESHYPEDAANLNLDVDMNAFSLDVSDGKVARL